MKTTLDDVFANVCVWLNTMATNYAKANKALALAVLSTMSFFAPMPGYGQDTTEKKPVATSSDSRDFTVNGVTFKMIKVEAGSFMMGQFEFSSEDCCFFDIIEHEVVLTSDYFIGQTEVSQALWKAVMGNNPSDEKGDNLPVESVTWYDCIDFIDRLNSLTGGNFRLPTEAEWEYAARGGKKSKGYKCIGSNNASEVMWGSDNTGVHSKPVGTKKPNELGLYNMAGNVSEWCQDWKGKYPQEKQIDPKGPSKEESDNNAKVCRGESIHRSVRYAFAMPAVRNQMYPDYKDYGTGRRLAMDAPAPPKFKWPLELKH